MGTEFSRRLVENPLENDAKALDIVRTEFQNEQMSVQLLTEKIHLVSQIIDAVNRGILELNTPENEIEDVEKKREDHAGSKEHLLNKLTELRERLKVCSSIVARKRDALAEAEEQWKKKLS